MDNPVTVLQNAAESTPFLTLVGAMLLAFVGALLTLAILMYIVRMFKAVRRYETLLRQARDIEDKLAEMRRGATEMQRQFDLKLVEAKENYNKELFALQQTVFERNSEILDLKTQLINRT